MQLLVLAVAIVTTSTATHTTTTTHAEATIDELRRPSTRLPRRPPTQPPRCTVLRMATSTSMTIQFETTAFGNACDDALAVLVHV